MSDSQVVIPSPNRCECRRWPNGAFSMLEPLPLAQVRNVSRGLPFVKCALTRKEVAVQQSVQFLESCSNQCPRADSVLVGQGPPVLAASGRYPSIPRKTRE